MRILTRNSRRDSVTKWLQMQGAIVPPILTALKHQSKVFSVELFQSIRGENSISASCTAFLFESSFALGEHNAGLEALVGNELRQ